MNFTGSMQGGLITPSTSSISSSSSHHISFLSKLNPFSNLFPPHDWYLVQSIVDRHLSRPIMISFRILGFICWAGQRWLDLIRIKKYKAKQPCFHTYQFCACAIKHIKESCNQDRPFLELDPVEIEDNRILQLSDKTDKWVCTIGLKLTTVLTAERSAKLYHPKSFGRYTVSKIYFNNVFLHIPWKIDSVGYEDLNRHNT